MSADSVGSPRSLVADPSAPPVADDLDERPPVGLRRPGSSVASVSLGLAALAFVAYPVLRPGGVESGAAAAEVWSSPTWVPAHLCAIAGFVLVGLGLLGLRDALAGYLGAWSANIAMLAWWVGSGLTLTYYGAETYALHALGGWVLDTKRMDVLALGTSVRDGQVQLVVFGAGLVLLAVAAVAVAVAVWRSQAMPPGAGLLFAIGFATYLPQFFLPDWLRIVHGVVVGVGCVVLAVQLRRLSSS